MAEFGKILLIVGLILVVAGFALILLGRIGIPLGRLPGDLIYRNRSTTVYFPLATSLVLSGVISLILFLVRYFRR